MAALLPILLGRHQDLWEQRLDAMHIGVAPGERERRSTR